MKLNWFDGLETKEQMNSLVIGEMEIIVGDLSTSANVKVLEIARSLNRLNKAWDAKKALLPAEPPREISHLDCTINLEKVEPLLAFPLVELGPECKKCQCFTCSNLFGCQISLSGEAKHCKTECKGAGRTYACRSFKPWTAELISRNEG